MKVAIKHVYCVVAGADDVLAYDMQRCGDKKSISRMAYALVGIFGVEVTPHGKYCPDSHLAMTLQTYE